MESSVTVSSTRRSAVIGDVHDPYGAMIGLFMFPAGGMHGSAPLTKICCNQFTPACQPGNAAAAAGPRRLPFALPVDRMLPCLPRKIFLIWISVPALACLMTVAMHGMHCRGSGIACSVISWLARRERCWDHRTSEKTCRSVRER